MFHGGYAVTIRRESAHKVHGKTRVAKHISVTSVGENDQFDNFIRDQNVRNSFIQKISKDQFLLVPTACQTDHCTYTMILNYLIKSCVTLEPE
jgi:hypothetical protein